MNNQHTQSPKQSVVIVGGGAAGWLTAALIAAEHRVASNPQIAVTLVESPDVRILGVGEGTWPTMRDTLRKIGIDETTFLRECDASFKQGTCFDGWVNGEQSDRYYHPFSLPAGFFEADIAAWWLSQQPQQQFAELFTTQSALCERALAPKQRATPPYAAVANYGYHLDANKFATLLKRHCVNQLGVVHVEDHIESVSSLDNGDITSVNGRTHGAIEGTLFIDCTGFAARLIGEHYGVPLTPVSNSLKNDTALAVQAPYKDAMQPIASATRSTAQAGGWIWDIGLPSRKGVGYVYASEYTSEQQARETLLAYLANDPTTADVDASAIRKISYIPGYRQTLWQNNCVAVGTSAGFLEPLEASALVMIELSAGMIAQMLPANRQVMDGVAAQFNQVFVTRWQRIIDFLKLHYVLSQRDDTYWQAMRDPTGCSVQLLSWLAQWQTRPPHRNDFIYSEEIFPTASYLFVLFGMGFTSKLDPVRFNGDQLQAAQAAIQHNQMLTQKHCQGLPGNRELLNALCGQPLNQAS